MSEVAGGLSTRQAAPGRAGLAGLRARLRRGKRAGRSSRGRGRLVALVGNPNCGKTTLFNALTGLRQRVGNYPGVTVEKKEGRLLLGHGVECTLLDLPGTYSLTAHSPDEQIAVDVLLGRARHTAAPDLVVCVVDAGNIERSLFLVSQLLDRSLPLVIALNMVDAAGKNGITVHARALERELGVRVVPTVASKRTGIEELKRAVAQTTGATGKGRQWALPEPVERECEELMGLLARHHQVKGPDAFDEAVALLTSDGAMPGRLDRYAPELRDHIRKDHQKLEFLGFDRRSVFVESRYRWIRAICKEAVDQVPRDGESLTHRIDRVVTHRVWGL